MQNSFLKNLSTFVFIAFCFPVSLVGQHNNSPLARADSLFQQKRYTQSFELYHSIFEQHQYTPAMLLKMAYIEEGLNRIAYSAYYLNLYYLATQDDAAQIKLDELSQKYRLEGYETSETDRLFTLYRQHDSEITLALSALTLFLFIAILVQGLRSPKKPRVAWGLLIVVSLLFLAHFNFGTGQAKAIITKNNTYIMTGPSAGASVIAVVRDGHRVNIKGKKDVWVKVEWGDTHGYIKETNVLPVML
jgi:Bacterial SH3 domain